MILYIRKNNSEKTGGTNLTNRQSRILKELYWTEEYISAEKLAERFGFSVKTIRNDIGYLKKWIQENELGKITSKNNAGFHLDITEENWKIALNEMHSDENRKSRLERNFEYFSVVEALLKEESVQINKLTSELYVSRNMMDYYLQKATEWFYKRGISVVKKRGSGMSLQTTEHNYRLALWSYYVEHVMKDTEKSKEFLWGFRNEGVEQAIKELEKKYDLSFSYDGYRKLMFLLSVMIIRIRQKHTHMETLSLQKTGLYYEMAGECRLFLEKVYKVEIAENEIAYLQTVLASAELQEINNPQIYSQFAEENKGLIYLIPECIQIVEKILNVSLEADVWFQNSLIYYAVSLQYNLKYGISVQNKATDWARVNYPDIYVAALSVGHILEPRFEKNLSENEISQITILIAAAMEQTRTGIRTCIVCDYNVGTSRLLQEQLKREFPMIQVTALLTPRDKEKIRKCQCDLILTTVELNGLQLGRNVILIHNMLGAEEKKKIAEYVKGYTGRNTVIQKKEAENSSYQLIKAPFIFHITEKVQKEALLHQMCEKLYHNGMVNKNYEETVLYRETVASTALSNRVAIPHGMPEYVKQPTVAIAVLDNPIRWNEIGQEVETVFLLAVNLEKRFGAKEQIIAFYSALVSLVDHPEEYEYFHELKTEKEIQNYLNKKIIEEKNNDK